MQTNPATAKGEATLQRILETATAEFAEHGFAGARIDRVAATARINKAQVYAYVGNKERLFDTVLAASFERITNVVPIDPEPGVVDLGDWAVRLYDEYLQRPDLIRLATWMRLERRPSGHLVPDTARMDSHKLDVIAAAQAAGTVRADADPFDVMAMVISMSMTWSPVSNVYAATAEEEEHEHQRRRTLLHDTVTRAFAP
ncbi:TetR family transcriptional regulator [Nakamurella sp. YIM 132087]|uniref:TetR family transcriptional regulator n=1 Tax=Nakamurella alba TaxID=2665158 RepID=A0A7K1FKS1_9ACTN|nr:TetR family transcriptional regulator [Nakamurella alba]MTD14735.1 TetR family transcriptional regulator [Nakamurella alba]